MQLLDIKKNILNIKKIYRRLEWDPNLEIMHNNKASHIILRIHINKLFQWTANQKSSKKLTKNFD